LLNACNNGQLLSDSIVFQVVAPLSVNAGRDTNICLGQSTQLLGAYTGGGGVNNVTWTPATGLSATNILNPVASPTAANTSYTLTVTPDGLPACAVSDVVNVGVLQGFNITTPPTTICRGQSVNIATTGDPRYTYTWIPATGLSTTTAPNTVATPDTSTTYTLTATYPGCPAASQSIAITVEPVPTVNAGRDTVLCYGSVLTMSPTVSPAFNAYSYSWTPATVFDFPTSLNPRFTAYDTVTATLTVTTPNGCTGKDSLVLTVVPKFFSNISADTGICPRDSAQLRSAGAVRYQWSPSAGLSSDTVAAPLASPVTTTLYTAITTNALGCRDTQSVEVTVFPAAVVELPDSIRLHPGEQARLDPRGNCLYFDWFPPYGLSADSIANPIANPGVNTRYFLTASTEWGCATRDSIDVFVDPESLIDVPNAFTPGSAPNALFRPSRRGLASIAYFRVYNRWGQKVYETATLDEGWDGRLNGEPQPLGVYIWELDATTLNGRRVKGQGNVTLLR
jgi:gliding motility-associated-like protein